MSTPAQPDRAVRTPVTLSVGQSDPPARGLGRWLSSGGRLDRLQSHSQTRPWYLVLWLTGVDYFSTLGYQPGIALLAAGALSPLATAILVAVTALGALPVYRQVALRSYAGQGSLAMLENLLPGWSGKIFVLVLLGFAATDFVITMTLSAADAAQHAVENPYLHPYLGEARLALTLGLLALLAVVFLKGFQEAIGLATAVAIPYLVLNGIVLVRGLLEIIRRPELFSAWQSGLALRGDWTMLAVAATLSFPKLALGMSGFETGVSVMPLVSEEAAAASPEADRAAPMSRIRATHKLLAAAVAIMALLLLGSSFITALLIPEQDYRLGGPAGGRAVAYLAHRLLGSGFGTVYDLSTIAILWFAGASAMAGLLNLVPRYLPRFGMAPGWVAFRRPLVLALFAVSAIVTIVFKANVEAQGGAYATGVLALILSAAVAVALTLGREGASALRRACYWGISALFAFTLVDNVIERPDGVVIATVFIVGVMATSALSRWRRATELRVSEVRFQDESSAELWRAITGRKVNLAPIRSPGVAGRSRKAAEIRRHYGVSGPLTFVHVSLLDNRSEFIAPLQIRVSREEDNFVVEVAGAIAIANTIAYLSELIDPQRIFLGLTRRNLMNQSLRYLLWGEGETGLLVYTILLRYWEWTPEEDVRPLIFLMSE